MVLMMITTTAFKEIPLWASHQIYDVQTIIDDGNETAVDEKIKF